MHFTSNLAANAATILTIASLVSAVPVTSPHSKTAKIQQVANSKYKKPSGPQAYAKGFLKYGATLPSDLAAALTQSADAAEGSVSATPTEYDSEYLCPVSIGTPAQVLNLDFDSGSSDL